MKSEKRLGNSGDKKWTCIEGCSLEVRACKHLEKELAKVYSKESVSAMYIENMERFPGARLGDRREAEAEAMNKRLIAYALSDIHRQVIVYHLVFGWSFSDIATTLGIPSKQTAHNIFRRGVETLRERGYRSK